MDAVGTTQLQIHTSSYVSLTQSLRTLILCLVDPTLKVARNQNWSNHDGRLYSYFPYPRLTLKKLIYYLKQHLKSLELAQHLAGRVVAERMMAKAMANFRGVNATRVKPKNVKN